MDSVQLLRDLAPFSDLGAEPPLVATDDLGLCARMVRNGARIVLRLPENVDGQVIELREGDEEVRHVNFRALLASDTFGQLRRWADTQRHLIQSRIGERESLISVSGFYSGTSSSADLAQADNALIQMHQHELLGTSILLIDGPAGIGKTHFIEQLALRRAENLHSTQRPLILHVESRGRVLTFVQDLIAFSLQRLRVVVTFDQVPVLVRHGLVTIAIDGFDELGDPNGYASAWSQVGELIEESRGQGTLIFAGRETFIGRERLVSSIQAISENRDNVQVLTLQPPDPETAKHWLRHRGWQEENFDKFEEFFDPAFPGLTPFFLSYLSEPDVVVSLARETASPIALLVKAMIARESGKFGELVDAALSGAQREGFVRQFLRETARDMADNQAEAVDATSLQWIVETVLGDETSEELTRLLQNRALVMTFLSNDDRPGFRRFAHSLLMNFFLSEALIDAVAREDIPKCLRRNILGSDFLATFSSVSVERSASDRGVLVAFTKQAMNLSRTYIALDRGSRNLGAMLLSLIPLADLVDEFVISNLDIDDAVIQGYSRPARVIDTSINQLDVRGADIRCVDMVNLKVSILIADDATIVPPALIPYQLQVVSGATSQLILNRDDIITWLSKRRVPRHLMLWNSQRWSQHNEESSIRRLLDRVLRYRGHWIREGSDYVSEKIVSDPEWPALLGMLRTNGFLREENRQASGPSSKFYHVRRVKSLLSDTSDDAVVNFYKALAAFEDGDGGRPSKLN